MHIEHPIPATLRFGRCELLPHERELRVDGEAVHLGGRAFDLLVALIEGRGKLVTKDEILNRVWPGVIVEENTLQAQISKLRKALGSDRAAFKTISGRGYRFVAEVTTASTEELPWQRAVMSEHVPPASTDIAPMVAESIARGTEISKVLDLISVAVELAAACLPTPGVDELARRLHDRLRLLSSGRRTALPLQQQRYAHESSEHREHAALAY